MSDLDTIEYRMKPQGPVLDRFMRSRARCTFIMGPLGSGKTIQACEKVFLIMTEQEPNPEGIRPTRFYAVRNTYPDLMATTVKDWLSLFGDLGQFRQGNLTPPTHTLRFQHEDGTIVESEVVFIALDRPEHVRKLRGAQVTCFWLNEAKELAKPVVDMADLRHGRYPSMASGGVKPTYHGMLGDTNAPDDDSWYYDQAEIVKPEEWEFFKQPGGVTVSGEVFIVNHQAENLCNLPAGYYQKGMQGKSRDWILVNLANEYGTLVDGKPIYPEYNDSMHCATGKLLPYRGLPLILSWDFGLTPACIISQITPRGQFRVLRELVAESMGIKQFSKSVVIPYLANEFGGMSKQGWGDPAGVQRAQSDETTCFQILDQVGLGAQPASTNIFMARREAVATLLTRLVDGKPGFIMDPSCKRLRKGFRGAYQYRKIMVAGEDRYTEKPDKNMVSHPHDALQYGALSAVAQIEAPPELYRGTYQVASNAGY